MHQQVVLLESAVETGDPGFVPCSLAPLLSLNRSYQKSLLIKLRSERQLIFEHASLAFLFTSLHSQSIIQHGRISSEHPQQPVGTNDLDDG